MSTGRKLWKIIVAALLLVPLFVGALGANAAEAGTADVTLHKRVFLDALPNPLIPNNGLEDNDFGGTPLADAGFTVYDVSEFYDTEIRKPGATQESVKESIVSTHETTPFGVVSGTVEQFTADYTGATKFENLPLTMTIGTGDTAKQIDAAYLFVETTSPSNPVISQIAAPMVVVMPVVIPNTTTINKDIHLYPKNLTETDNQKEFVNESDYTLTVNGETFNSVQIGDPLNYKINVNMPDISKLDSFKVIDEPGVGMDLADPNNLSLPGLTLGTDYTVDYDGTDSGRGFVIDFKDTAAVRNLAGKVLTITYTMTLTEDAPIDTAINNNASIQVDVETTTEFTPPNPVFTHGKQFKKVNGQTGEELTGAKFKVYREIEVDEEDELVKQWAQFDLVGNAYVFSDWVADEEEATEIESGTGGIARIQGLRVGDYTLVETQAPDGYVLVDSEIQFTIVKGGYANPQDIKTVNNFRKGLLPSTGGSGIYAFLIIGAMMMGGAYIWFKRSKEQAEV